MIITHILGGLGNQMFQYAAGQSLAYKCNQDHCLDLSDFAKYQLHHGFELNRVFNLTLESTEPAIVRGMLGWRANFLVKKILRRPQFRWLRGGKFVVEPYFNYWSNFTRLKGNCYLYGYWQSESYFKSYEQIIRSDFTFRAPLDARNLELTKAIEESNSVSLHVRRGDYISDSKTNSIMNVCSIEYYERAVKHIAKSIGNPNFYIFSDDIDWVKEKLIMIHPCTYIDINRGEESYKDMQLMSLCKHNIIANSSFSWWGAWLNPNNSKIVIAPKIWFVNGINDTDLIPSEWIRL